MAVRILRNFVAVSSRRADCGFYPRTLSTTAPPLIESHRTFWPDVENAVSKNISSNSLKRTIRDEVLRFNMTARLDHGSSIFYPHLRIHPADFKVSLKVVKIFPCFMSSILLF
jgi:hypothetical protein